jgi:hypothetical protein
MSSSNDWSLITLHLEEYSSLEFCNVILKMLVVRIKNREQGGNLVLLNDL